MQEKINKWIENGCIFSEGVVLLASTGKYNPLVRSISGRPHRYADKLRYELLKLASAGSRASTSVFDKINLEPVPEKNTPSPDPKKQLPPDVEHVIKLLADAYKTRSILHAAMSELPSGNPKQLVLKRKNLSDDINACSNVIDTMFQAKEDYYVNGTIPDIQKLTDSVTGNTTIAPLPDSIELLKELKKQIQSKTSKDQFMLEYRQYFKGENPNPMPKGPKRTKIELRLKSHFETLESIDTKLHELA